MLFIVHFYKNGHTNHPLPCDENSKLPFQRLPLVPSLGLLFPNTHKFVVLLFFAFASPRNSEQPLHLSWVWEIGIHSHLPELPGWNSRPAVPAGLGFGLLSLEGLVELSHCLVSQGVKALVLVIWGCSESWISWIRLCSRVITGSSHTRCTPLWFLGLLTGTWSCVVATENYFGTMLVENEQCITLFLSITCNVPRPAASRAV